MALFIIHYIKQWDKNTFVISEYTFRFECNSEINIFHENLKNLNGIQIKQHY